ncbi:response regulator [Spirosoma sp. HMF3257]|uniref:histidine kinase n=1 Tax=Spirosoma telluris TaxID=2183553 RepID=A0A327NS25_9BACT|nr:response regulator [Spirosoma telluris]RAI78160.1 hypothetical protein HMF3257_36035 [Spirosoma telluris]
MPYIFDRFYQVDASQRRGYEGTGVGLALVRELVRLLDGEITANSQLEVGTTMTVVLPIRPATKSSLAVPSPANRLTTESSDQSTTGLISPGQFDPVERSGRMNAGLSDLEMGHQSSVLIVEDNDDLRTYIRSVLSPHYRILEAVDGLQGRDIAQQAMPDLIVTDLMMPRLDGLELCRALRSDNRTNHIPVVMLTAKAAIENRLEGLETGADDYLTKPFVPVELIVRLQNLLRRQENIRAYFQRQLALPIQERQAEAPEKPNPLTEQQQFFVKSLYATLEQYLDHPEFDVDALAAAGSMSSRNLNRKLNTLMGITANEFIRTYRLRRAADLLRTGLTPTETAYRVGFDNPSYFSRLFKETFTVTPSEYGKKNTSAPTDF